MRPLPNLNRNTADPDQPPTPGLALIGTFADTAQARERGLVILSMGLPYWIRQTPPPPNLEESPPNSSPNTPSQPRLLSQLAPAAPAPAPPSARTPITTPETPVADHTSTWQLWAPRKQAAAILRQIALYEKERTRFPPAPQPSAPEYPADTISWVVACLLIALVSAQPWIGYETLHERGQLQARAIFAQGEWWRALTALTLHADLAHLSGNLLGLLSLGWLTSKRFGGGIALAATLTAAILGNLLNAWVYFPQEHRSIGASTAVFAQIGIIIGSALIDRLRENSLFSLKTFIPPAATALALLSWLTGTDAQIDHGAHLAGFASGFLIALPLTKIAWHYPARIQLLHRPALLATAILTSIAWICAIHN